jgi:hypothetical protein
MDLFSEATFTVEYTRLSVSQDTTVPLQLVNEKAGGDCVRNVAKISTVHNQKILRQDQIVFSTYKTQFTPDFSSANCSGTVLYVLRNTKTGVF